MDEDLKPSSKIWLLSISYPGARVFQFEESERKLRFYREIPNLEPDVPSPTELRSVFENNEFIMDVTRLMDELITHEDDDSLILCGDPDLVDAVRPQLSHTVQNRIIGTIGQDLYDVNESDLMIYVKDFIRSQSDLTGRREVA